MAHIPVNHPARPFYRTLAAATSLYVLGFGIVGLIETWGRPLFDRGDTWALGLQTNPAFSFLSIGAGLVLLGAAVYGRNIDHFLHIGGSVVFYVSGFIMMALLRTDLNFLNFSMRNCIVSYLIGTVFLLAGLYGKVGNREFAEAEDSYRHGEVAGAGHER